MSQGDSIYEFVDKRDHAVWQSHLVQASKAAATNTTYSGGRRADTVSDRRGTTTTTTTLVDTAFCCRMFRSRNSRRLPPAWTENKV